MSLSLSAIRLAHRASILKRTLGTRTAAGFLRNRGIPLPEALLLLTGSCRELS